MSRAGFAALLILIAAACADEGSNANNDMVARQPVRGPDFDCLQRLVSIPEQAPTGGGQRMGNAFDRLAGLYESMPLEGCTEDQRSRAGILASRARRIAELTRTIGNPGSVQNLPPREDLTRNAAFLELQNEIEGWTNRQRVMREELQRMTAARR